MNLRIAKKIMKHIVKRDAKPMYNNHQITTAKSVVTKHTKKGNL
jgi:hypothetical protein